MSSNKPTTTSRRAFMASVPAIAATLTPAAAASLSGLAPQAVGISDVDPIYAAIAEHRAAFEAMATAFKITGSLRPGPEFDAADVVSAAASQREYKALLPVLTTQPTTMAGIIALLDHVGMPDYFQEIENESILSAALRDTPYEMMDAVQGFPHALAATLRRLTATA